MSETPEGEYGSIEYARAFCLQICQEYWETVRKNTSISWRFRNYKELLPNLSAEDKSIVADISCRLQVLMPEDACYEISIRYMDLLPEKYRAKNGIFYTPMYVVEKMLSDATRVGIDFKKAKVIDPAAGGAAYLAPLCRRLIKKNYKSDQDLVDDVTSRLIGFELDPFAAWLSQFVLDCTLAYKAPKAKMPPRVVHTMNALSAPESYYGQFDYVIGNPPYGITSLSEEASDKYDDVISGKPNLYQLFYRLAFLLVRDKGYVHFITPAGFIGGTYFKRLRYWIESRSTAVSFSFFNNRLGVFPGVQQELVIALFHKMNTSKNPQVYCLENKGTIIGEKICTSPFFQGDYWVLPRSKTSVKAGKLFTKVRPRFEELGFSIKTGHVVPHRSEKKMGNSKKSGSYPLIWSESIQDSKFKPERPYERGRYKWYTCSTQTGFIRDQAILIKRTSSKEQTRRIHTAIVDSAFIKHHGGFFAENHINILTANDKTPVDLPTLNKLINTELFDQLFRCNSGTVTVSVSELKRLPLPSSKGLKLFAKRVKVASCSEDIEEAAWKAYEVST